MYIDAHSHRPSPGMGIFTLMSCPPESTPAHDPPFTRVCCGIHPWQTVDMGAVEESWRVLSVLAGTGRLAAVGECGLDRRRGAALPEQLPVFRRQLELAEQHGLPVVVHCVKAFVELAALRWEFSHTPWLIHGYGGKGEIPAGCLVSLGPAVLRRSHAAQILKSLPENGFLLETDDSGADITAVYHQAAALLGRDARWLEERLEHNFTAAFGAVFGAVNG